MSSSTATSQPGLQADAAWETVCLVDDLVPGSGVCVLFNHRQVALFTIGKPARLYAIGNYDPFSEANVLSRGIVGSLKGRPVVASPIFKQHFCLDTGACLEDAAVRVDVFPARISGGHVQLQRPQPGA